MSLLGAANRLGLELGQEALSALESLPYAHALELLQDTQQKLQGGSLKDPTNYICATVERGYVPSAGSLMGRQGTGGPMVAAGLGCQEAAAQALMRTKGMQMVKAAGLSLSGEALEALLTVPASHASEILEAVAEKHTELQNPSNFVVATIWKRVAGTDFSASSSGGQSTEQLPLTLLESRSSQRRQGSTSSAWRPATDLEDLRAAGGTAKAASVRCLRQPANAVRLAVNSQYICCVDSTGTKVQVISAASGSAVVCIGSHEAKVVDMAVAPRDSLLLVAFNSSRVLLCRLPEAKPSMLLTFDDSPQAVDWHPSNPKVFLTLHHNYVLLWHLQAIVHYIAVNPPETPMEEREAKNQLFVSTEVQEAVASKATADQLAEGWLQRMAITPDGSRLFAISDNQIWRWSVCVEEKWPAAVEFLGVAQEQDDSERAAAPAETEVHESDDPALAFAEDAAAEPRRQLEDTPPRTQEQLRVALEAANVLLELAAADHGDRPGPP